MESTTENIHPYAEVWEPVLSLKKITVMLNSFWDNAISLMIDKSLESS